MTAPLPVCSAKLSLIWPGQYYGGGPRWNPWCCSFPFVSTCIPNPNAIITKTIRIMNEGIRRLFAPFCMIGILAWDRTDTGHWTVDRRGEEPFLWTSKLPRYNNTIQLNSITQTVTNEEQNHDISIPIRGALAQSTSAENKARSLRKKPLRTRRRRIWKPSSKPHRQRSMDNGCCAPRYQ